MSVSSDRTRQISVGFVDLNRNAIAIQKLAAKIRSPARHQKRIKVK